VNLLLEKLPVLQSTSPENETLQKFKDCAVGGRAKAEMCVNFTEINTL